MSFPNIRAKENASVFLFNESIHFSDVDNAYAYHPDHFTKNVHPVSQNQRPKTVPYLHLQPTYDHYMTQDFYEPATDTSEFNSNLLAVSSKI